jgi:hypothetical protein
LFDLKSPFLVPTLQIRSSERPEAVKSGEAGTGDTRSFSVSEK